ncbi:MAG: DMT family transporter [Defluviicoccus sp.]|nr:DMT family transporter [Defluviicoccus sp.]MDE0386511.1 DMT family transporter [Defluviicoccus sp.]
MTGDAFRRMPGAVRGALWMLLAAAFFSAMTACIRHLAETGFHPLMTSFWRSVIGMALLLPFFLRQGVAGLATKRHGLFLGRGLASAAAQAAFFLAVAFLPLADAVSLTFTAPLFGALLAVLFLGESVGLRRAAVLAAGFLGVLVILRPGFKEVDWQFSMPLVAALGMATIWILVKRLSATEPTERIVFYMIAYTVPVSFAMALFVWQTPTLEQLAWLVVTAVVANSGQFAMTNSYRAAEATSVFPFDFARLPLTALLAWLAFTETPDLWTWAGAAIIFAASAQQMRAERRRPAP